MKKGLALCMAAVLAMGCLLTGCGSSDTGAKSTTESAAASTEAVGTEAAGTETAGNGKTFTVGFDASFPPYGYVENGEYVGFDIDLAKEVAKRNGWNIKLQAIDWNSKDFELNSGTISCIWNGFTMNGREDKYTWTRAYVDNSQVVVVKADSGINELSDLAGKTVAVQDDSSALAVLTNTEDNDEMLALAATFNKLDKVGDYDTAFMNLASGAVDAIAMDIGVAQFKVKAGGDKYKILDKQLASEQYGVGFRKGSDAAAALNEFFRQQWESGALQALAEQYGVQAALIEQKEF